MLSGAGSSAMGHVSSHCHLGEQWPPLTRAGRWVCGVLQLHTLVFCALTWSQRGFVFPLLHHGHRVADMGILRDGFCPRRAPSPALSAMPNADVMAAPSLRAQLQLTRQDTEMMCASSSYKRSMCSLRKAGGVQRPSPVGLSVLQESQPLLVSAPPFPMHMVFIYFLQSGMSRISLFYT